MRAVCHWVRGTTYDVQYLRTLQEEERARGFGGDTGMLALKCNFLFRNEWRDGTGPSAAACIAIFLAREHILMQQLLLRSSQLSSASSTVLQYVLTHLSPPRDKVDALRRLDQHNARRTIDVRRPRHCKALQAAACCCKCKRRALPT
jgi:hypothetical protein